MGRKHETWCEVNNPVGRHGCSCQSYFAGASYSKVSGKAGRRQRAALRRIDPALAPLSKDHKERDLPRTPVLGSVTTSTSRKNAPGALGSTKAGPVKVTKADGTVRYVEPYSRSEQASIKRGKSPNRRQGT